MTKKLFQTLTVTLLLVAAFSVFTVSPSAFAATHHAHRASVSAIPKAPTDTYCRYQVTATAGLNVREGPGTNYAIRYTLAYGATVLANSNVTYGTGYYWHNLADGHSNDWAAANWLQRVLGGCFTQ